MRKITFIAIGIISVLSLLSACTDDQEQEVIDRENYLKEHNITTEPTASGLYYIETLEGTGTSPGVGDMVKVDYEGRFLDGTIFDSSYERGTPFEFQLGAGEVILGWDEGINLMKKGGKATLIVPSNLAYGSRGYYTIPPYTTLVFDIELIDVN